MKNFLTPAVSQNTHPKGMAWHSQRLLLSFCNAPCRYGALKSLGEKKACFNEYAQQRKNEEKEEARAK